MRSGVELQPLDVVELEVGPPTGCTRYQSENRPLLSPVRLVGRLSAVELRHYAEIDDQLLHSLDDRVTPEYLDRLPPDRWKSLALIRPRQLSFARDQFKPHRFRVNFLDPFWNRYSLKLTDPAAIAILNRGERLSARSFLIVSLTEPYRAAASDLPPLCYKLVAGVVDF